MRRKGEWDRSVHAPYKRAKMPPKLGLPQQTCYARSVRSSHRPRAGTVETRSRTHQDRRERTALAGPFAPLYALPIWRPQGFMVSHKMAMGIMGKTTI